MVTSATDARAHITYRAVGHGAARWRQWLRNPGQERMYHSQLASTVLPGARVLDGRQQNHDDIVAPLVIELDTDIAGAIQPNGDNYQLPVLNLFDLTRLATLEERTNPIFMPPPVRQSLRFELELPPRGRVVQAPPEVDVEHDCFTVSQHSRVEGRRVIVEQAFERRCARLSVEDYPGFRDAVQRAANQLLGQLVMDLP